MLQYLKYLPLLTILAKHPNIVKAFSDSLPDVTNIAKRFEPLSAELQNMITEFENSIRQIEGTTT